MKSKARWVAVAALVVGGVLIVHQGLATTGDEPTRTGEEENIRKASEAFARAFEKGDAKAVGAFFTQEGEYVDEDSAPIRGRAALEKAYAQFFAKRTDVKVTSKTDKIRFVGKDTAVEEGTFTVHAKDRPSNSSHFSTLYVREDGRWRIAMLKEWGDDKANQPKVEDLAWLIGSWEYDGPEMVARTDYDWIENKKFMRCRFTITNKKDKTVVSKGTQIIGVDPAYDLIRAWTFDSEGGIGEANWTHDGDRWSIHSRGSQGDGSETTAVNFLNRIDDNTFTWRSVNRMLDGERQSDIPSVRVKRVSK
jgi:uncharacterized protein (TIGR02246 family)